MHYITSTLNKPDLHGVTSNISTQEAGNVRLMTRTVQDSLKAF